MPLLIRNIGGNKNAFNFRLRDVQKGRIKSLDRKASKERIENYDEKNYISKKKQEVVFRCKCNAGFKPGVVLDPFIGSGTTAIVAKKLRYNYLGFENNKDYVKIANRRVKNAN